MSGHYPDGTTQADLDAVDLDGDRCLDCRADFDAGDKHAPWCIWAESGDGMDEPANFEPEEL